MFFSIPSIFTVVVKYLVLSTILFILSILSIFDSDSLLASSIVEFSVSVTFRTSRLLTSFCLHDRANWAFFPQLFHVWSSAEHLWVELQYGALQNMHCLLLLNWFLGRVLSLSILSFRMCFVWSYLLFSSSRVSFRSLICLGVSCPHLRSYILKWVVLRFGCYAFDVTFFFDFYQSPPEIFRCFGFSLFSPEEFSAVVICISLR